MDENDGWIDRQARIVELEKQLARADADRKKLVVFVRRAVDNSEYWRQSLGDEARALLREIGEK